MKNAIIAILLLVVLVAGYSAATNMRMSLDMLEGVTTTLTVGDLTVPINATGEIKPVRRVQIKSEASGEVIEIGRQAGERVRKGDLIIRLQRDDEQRKVNRAELRVTVSKAALEEAKILRKQAQTADMASAVARVRQMEATLVPSRDRVRRVEENAAAYTEEERLLHRSTYEVQSAQLDSAKAALTMAEFAIPRARQAVIRAEANYESAQNDLGDALKQLAKTEVTSPIDGMVADIRTQTGEVIQGGKNTITGGTVLAVVLDMSTLVLRAEVDEADVGRVLELAPPWAAPGHEATQRMPEDMDAALAAVQSPTVITVETFPGEIFQGVIERIYPEPTTVANVTTYLVDVVIVSPNKDRLLPGMRAEVSFTSEHVTGVVLCPNEAIKKGKSGEYGVYVPKKDPLPGEWPAEWVPCEIGLTDGAFTEIKAGLTEGTTVYTKLPAKRDDDKKKSGRRRN